MGYLKAFKETMPKLREITCQTEQDFLQLDPTIEVYNPFTYGIDCYLKYLETFFANSFPKLMLVGINPGLGGAIQTCIPFTDVYNCKRILRIDPLEYVTCKRNVNPRRYVNEQEDSAKLFYLALEEYDITLNFLESALLINSFPLGLSRKSKKRNKGGFYAKNENPDNLTGLLGKKAKDFAKAYLGLLIESTRTHKILTLGNYPHDLLKEMGLNSEKHTHPSDRALNNKNLSKEQWKADFVRKYELLIER